MDSLVMLLQKSCYYIFTNTQVMNSFTTFYTIYTVMKTRSTARSTTRRNTIMLNIHVEITIMRCQSATVMTKINVTNTNNSVTDTFCTRPATDIKFLRLNRFDNIRGWITNILTDTAVIWKCSGRLPWKIAILE